MRIRVSSILLLAASLCLGTAKMASAQFSIDVTVDENGNGRLTNTNPFSSPLPSSIMADPGPGGLGAVLNYGLLSPPGLVAGDLELLDQDSTISDLIRFDPATGGGSLFFYSAPGLDLADVGFPTANDPNLITTSEDLSGTTLYTPTAGEPGFVAGAAGPVTYHISSDEEPTGTPEPGSLALFIGFGVAGVFAHRRARKP